MNAQILPILQFLIAAAIAALAVSIGAMFANDTCHSRPIADPQPSPDAKLVPTIMPFELPIGNIVQSVAPATPFETDAIDEGTDL